MRCMNYLAQSWCFEVTSAVFAPVAPSPPPSSNSSILIVPVVGVGIGPTVGGGLSHSPGSSEHPRPLALVIN